MHITSVKSYSVMALLAALTPTFGHGAIQIHGQRANRANAYQELNAQIQMANAVATTVPQTVDQAVDALPVRVANESLAKQIVSGQSSTVGVNHLEQCAKTNPGAEMIWAQPTLGTMAGTGSTCVSVVEMIGYQMGPNGTNAVLARGYLAAGDVVRCNISDFPEGSYLEAAGTVTFPADAAPTIEDVTAIMDEEQKQNAGFKIAATMIVGGLAGNLAGKNEPGKSGMLGGGKDKITSTVIGAVGGGALAAAGSFGGKVAGDTIMGAGVNAVAGGVVGNMAASGDDILRIERCVLPDKRETTCLWGLLTEKKDLGAKDITVNGETVSATQVGFLSMADFRTTIVCDLYEGEYINCAPQELVAIKIEVKDDKDGTKTVSLDDMKKENYTSLQDKDGLYLNDGKMTTQLNDKGQYVEIKSAGIREKSTPVVLADVEEGAFGLKKDEWKEIKKNKSFAEIHGRSDGMNTYALKKDLIENITWDNFEPLYRSASDGGIVDISNKARLKSTGIGAAAGGALGGYAAYEGAQGEIQERWVAAVQEYKDSLYKFSCVSGNKFMAAYNDNAAVPMMVSE